MNRKMISIALILAMLLSTVVVSLAQPFPNSGPYPSGPGNGLYPSGPGNGPYPSGPGNGPYPSVPGNLPYPPGQGQGNQLNPGGNPPSTGGQGSQGGHPQSGPSSVQPQVTPQASTGKTATNLGQGQQLSQQEVANIGGAVSTGAQGSGGNSGGAQTYKLVIGPTLRYWALYNGQWTMDATGIYYGQQMNTLLYNDQGQYLWSYEQYPNGYVDWQSLGYMYPGYYNMWFQADAYGWHQTAIWGSNSGWSNVLWIYVW